MVNHHLVCHIPISRLALLAIRSYTSVVHLECMPTIEELDCMDDISGPVLYSAELHRLPFYTPEEEADHISQARAGNEESQAALLTLCLPWLMVKATTIYFAYHPMHSDVMDLVGHANVEMVEALPNELQARSPVKYLMSVGAFAMRRYCYYNDPLIKRPRYQGRENALPTTVSLESGDWPFIESLAAPNVSLAENEAAELKMQVQDQIVYDAMQRLSPRYRSVLTNHYGLYGQPVKRPGDIAEELGVSQSAVEHVIKRAKIKTAAILAPYVLDQSISKE